jgi:hypothetical protein
MTLNQTAIARAKVIASGTLGECRPMGAGVA